MSDATAIEWCDSTFNPWIGCTKVGPGCDHCYAEADFDHRRHRVQWGAGNPRSRTSPENWRKPLGWNAGHEKFFAEHGRRRRVFCASLADVFDNEVPIGWFLDLLDLIRLTPNLDWLLLTKRIGNWRTRLERARNYAVTVPHADELIVWISTWLANEPPANVWLGATVVNQVEANRDIPKLLEASARVRFLSIEPMLGPIDIDRAMYGTGRRGCNAFGFTDGFGEEVMLNWVIAGGESGKDARPMHPDWARSLRDQCQSAGVPFLFKQWGEWAPTPMEALRHLGLSKYAHLPKTRESDIAGTKVLVNGKWVMYPIHRPGKKAAGRLLDGREWNGFPEINNER